MASPRFRVSVAKKAPLRIQAQPPTGGYLEVLSADVGGDTKVGSASRPVLTFPSTIGKGTSMVPTCLTFPTKASNATAVSVFTSAPSYPIVNLIADGLPYSTKIEFPRGHGIMVMGSDAAILLFVATPPSSTLHTLSGGIEWEEY